MIEALLGFIDEESLLVSGFGEDAGGIGLALGKMRSTKTAYQTTNQINDENDLNNMFETQLTSLLLSSLTGGTSIMICMKKHSINSSPITLAMTWICLKDLSLKDIHIH